MINQDRTTKTDFFWYFSLNFLKIKLFFSDFSPENTYLSTDHSQKPIPSPLPLISVIWAIILNWSRKEFTQKKFHEK